MRLWIIKKEVEMKKRLWILILLSAFLLIIVTILIINSSKHKTGLAASYSGEKGQITVKVTRPSDRHETYGYESRPGGEKIVSLSNHNTEGDTDVFVFDILGNGETELTFYSIDPKFANEKYKYTCGLKIVVTDNAINLNNELWRRN